jgi:hypothetical protein
MRSRFSRRALVFWDRPHNVTGRAPNAIELHPILDFACVSSSISTRQTKSELRGRHSAIGPPSEFGSTHVSRRHPDNVTGGCASVRECHPSRAGK